MGETTESATPVTIDVATRGRFPGAAEYARDKIGGLFHLADRPVLYARVRLTEHADPAVSRPVIAQANLDVSGRVVRAQVDGVNAREAIDRLTARLRQRLERTARHWEARRGARPVNTPHEWRHDSVPAHRPGHFLRPVDERRVVRRKSIAPHTCTVDEAVHDMELLDYDFYFFTESGTGFASVLYRGESGVHRLAQVVAPSEERLAHFESPVTLSAASPPCVTIDEAVERMGLLGLPFLFFIDAAEGRAAILYHRYDGHYGLISPAD
ncbi:ribosome hibernation promotion factor [Mycobacterium sp. IDR2000157661]|uniref:ribosome hibernation promotion factor n=1 Tax=Mycobacterium sp. IDR2000157661 TaxID=2867005 RepID=UPI001EEC5328|nr:HPF/RaiA family ribosome-associated protein [Mycobacterium sp. IDR2000157661]ULE33417.1 HPF/RaiA family ribosome-associated protein [Mycobacterium sp. IDR2000157661]